MKKTTFIPDKVNCSFWWQINMPENERASTITGYSKFQNYAEAKDKLNCLVSKIEMLKKNGYIDKCISILIYKKIGAFPSTETDKHIITLRRKDYVIECLDLLKRNDFVTYIKKFYSASAGERVENLKPFNKFADYKKSYNKDGMLDVRNYHFIDTNSILKECENLRRMEFSHDAVQNFYIKAVERQMSQKGMNR